MKRNVKNRQLAKGKGTKKNGPKVVESRFVSSLYARRGLTVGVLMAAIDGKTQAGEEVTNNGTEVSLITAQVSTNE